MIKNANEMKQFKEIYDNSIRKKNKKKKERHNEK